MASFIHTADWQIGKPFLQVKDTQKRFKLSQERLNVVARINDLAVKECVQFILVAGDLFDSPTPSPSIITEVLELIGSIDIPVFVIPGNHDHGALGTVWHSDYFKKYQQKIAPNLQILLDRHPIELKEAVILPCPLLRKKDNSDPTQWLRDFNWSSISIDKPRIVLAHGSVRDFVGRDYLIENSKDNNVNNMINISRLPQDEIDYIALGDWHNLKKVTSRAWYSGTPEPDRFDQGSDNKRGQVLEVKVCRGEEPQINSFHTGRIQWHNISFTFNCDNDLNRFRRLVDELIDGRVFKDLLRVEVSGTLSLSTHKYYESLINDLNNNLIRLRIKGECQKQPKPEELEQLTRSAEDPLVSQVASLLQERLNLEESNQSEEANITRLALCELYRFAVKV